MNDDNEPKYQLINNELVPLTQEEIDEVKARYAEWLQQQPPTVDAPLQPEPTTETTRGQSRTKRR